MADNLNIRGGGATDPEVATDDVAGVHYQRVKLDWGGDGAAVPATGPNTPAIEGTDITGATMPPGGASTRGWLSAIWKAVTEASADIRRLLEQLVARDAPPSALDQGKAGVDAWKVDGSGVVQPVSGSVAVSNLPATQPVSGSVSVSNLPATQSIAGTGGPLTTALIENDCAAAVYDTQARRLLEALLAQDHPPTPLDQGKPGPDAWLVDGSDVTQPVSATALPLPTGAATDATLAAIQAQTANLDVPLSTRTKPADTQKVDGSAVVQPVSGSVSVSNLPATQTIAGTGGTLTTTLIENDCAAAVYDTQLRRLLEELLAREPAPPGPHDQGKAGTDAWKVDGSGVIQPIAGAVSVTNLPAAPAISGTGGPLTTALVENDCAAAVYDTQVRRLLEQLVLQDAGTPAIDQGNAGTDPWQVDGSSVIQPVSGTVTIAGLPPVSGTVTAIEVGSSGLPATITPRSGDVAQAVYDTDLRWLLEALLLEIQLMRLNQEAHFARAQEPLAAAWGAAN